MPGLLIIIIVLTVNLLPANVKEFSVGISAKKTIVFSQQKDGGWKATKMPRGKNIGTFYVKGFIVTTIVNGRKLEVDASKFLGIKTLDQIKSLKQIKDGSQEINIEKKDSDITLKVKAIKDSGIKIPSRSIKISWTK